MNKNYSVEMRCKMLDLTSQNGYSESTRKKLAEHMKNTCLTWESGETEAERITSLMEKMTEEEVLEALNLK